MNIRTEAKSASPLISVVLPCYKVEKYLPRAVESLLNQTWPNMEIILVDDGSPDACGDIADRFAVDFSQVISIHQKNAGVSAARNVGLEKAHGEYIGFVDPDDFVTPDMYEFLYNVMQKGQAQISVCAYDDYYVNRIIPYRKEQFCDVISAEQALVREIEHGIYITCNKLFTRSVIKNIRYNLKYINGEDRLFTVSAVLNSNYVAYDLNIPKYHYYHRQGSAGNKAFTPMDYKLLELCHVILDMVTDKAPKAVSAAQRQLLDAHIKLLDMNPAAAGYDNYELMLRESLKKVKREMPDTLNIPWKDEAKLCLMEHSARLYYGAKQIYGNLKKVTDKKMKLFD